MQRLSICMIATLGLEGVIGPDTRRIRCLGFTGSSLSYSPAFFGTKGNNIGAYCKSLPT